MVLNKYKITMDVQKRLVPPAFACAFFLCLAIGLLSLLAPGEALAALPTPTENCASTDNTTCKVCINENPSTFSTPNAGKNMINQVFTIINKIIQKIESSFYKGIIGSTSFKNIMNAAFIMYIATYGIMITFGLASYRGGEVASRLIKLAIVYAMTAPTGWTFFSTWVQQPLVGAINELITVIANVGGAGSGSGSCISSGVFSGGSIATSGGTSSMTISLQTGPMAMLFGPMTCLFAARFMASIEALITTGFYGWVLALMLLWGLLEFTFMLFGAIVTYVKAIIGLTFLFGLAPIFMAFYLFEKTRKLTEGWFAMLIGFAIQPVLLFAFLAFYAAIIGTALNGVFADSGGGQKDVCYVPWYNMPGMITWYWWRFVNSSGVAGGEYLNTASGATGAFGSAMPPPAKVLSILYFIVLSSLGKSFSRTIAEIAVNLSAAGEASGKMATTTGEDVGNWVKGNVMGGRGVTDIATDAAGGFARSTSSIYNRIFGLTGNTAGRTDTVARPTLAKGPLGEFGEFSGGSGLGDD